MGIYKWKQWRKDGEFRAEPGQEIEEKVYDTMRRCMEPLPLAAPEYGMESGFVMGQETVSREGEPVHMAFGEKGGRFYYLGEDTAWK